MCTGASAAWLFLVALTCVSWVVGTWHGSPGENVPASLVIIAVAVFKVRLVGLHFMELRDAPWQLRGTFEGYCVVLLGLLCTLYAQ